MLNLDLWLTVVLTFSASLSILLLLVHGRSQSPSIRLETGAEDDPLNILEPQDVDEGVPLDEEKFWMRLRIRKKWLAFSQAIVVALSLVTTQPLHFPIQFISVLIPFHLYVLSLSVLSISEDGAAKHRGRTVTHITWLSTLSALLFSLKCLIPITPSTAGTSVALNSALAVASWVPSIISATTPFGPKLHYPLERIFPPKVVKSATQEKNESNVSGIARSSIIGFLSFLPAGKVVKFAKDSISFEIADLPILPASLRASRAYHDMRTIIKEPSTVMRSPTRSLLFRLVRLNAADLATLVTLCFFCSGMFYARPFFLSKIIAYIQNDPQRENVQWGLFYCVCMGLAMTMTNLTQTRLWSLCMTDMRIKVKMQLNTVLFAKTLVRKDVGSPTASDENQDAATDKQEEGPADSEDAFESKAQVHTLMTVDVDQISEFPFLIFPLLGSPLEITVGSLFLYSVIGSSTFVGLATMVLLIPVNHFGTKAVINAQQKLMKSRDERMSLMNEILGAIRMLKFMAWERPFETRVLKIREKELKFQRRKFMIQLIGQLLLAMSPVLVTIVCFWHFTIIRQKELTPTIGFTSLIVLMELRFALSSIPPSVVDALQCYVSLRRIAKYMETAEVAPVPPLSEQSQQIAFQSCTATWPRDRSRSSPSSRQTPTSASTPQSHSFSLIDLNLNFPLGELSLVCGKLGSGKSLLLLTLLGESDILAGQVICPRTPPNMLASLAADEDVSEEEWVVAGTSAYVPQTAWLRNASIQDNILFGLHFNPERYSRTIEACALLTDFDILEDGDQTEIGERGVNLSGGQKARVSLARAVYSRAAILFLDDVLSAVDAQTADHLYHNCLKSDLMARRTVILVSHHIQLCVQGASYVVALDNGHVAFEGSRNAFKDSPAFHKLIHTADSESGAEESNTDEKPDKLAAQSGETEKKQKVKDSPAREFVGEETRAVGRVNWDIWSTYFHANGSLLHWLLFATAFILAAISPVIENAWLKNWTRAVIEDGAHDTMYYLKVYALLATISVTFATLRWFVLYLGSLRASSRLYKTLLDSVLFATIRTHDTTSRGRLLNRFGKDIEVIDNKLAGYIGETAVLTLDALAGLITVAVIGGIPFLVVALLCFGMYYHAAASYTQCARDLRRLESVSVTPLYSIYGEIISGATVLRAYGASSKLLREMIRYVDANCTSSFWVWGVGWWLGMRFRLISSLILTALSIGAVLTRRLDAALVGFGLTMASEATEHVLFMVHRYVSVERSMIAVERVKEYTELQREAPEFEEPRPDASWPREGAIKCEGLVVRYAPELPSVLHGLTFDINPGEKVGILGRTASGKSTLALSFFRFVEASEGRILIDGVDISHVGLSDLRNRITIIPQDPTILSGTLRSCLDVFDEYDDVDIFEALRRVHLLPPVDTPDLESDSQANVNVFQNLDGKVTEDGGNFSAGEKQLLCMARAILKRAKVLVMDEATASVDYHTDELIHETISREFTGSTILTIAHRIRTVIDHDRVMVLDQGRIVEFDSPKVLIRQTGSKFHELCRATGPEEFAVLKRIAGA